jgi:hypothetical protein
VTLVTCRGRCMPARRAGIHSHGRVGQGMALLLAVCALFRRMSTSAGGPDRTPGRTFGVNATPPQGLASAKE